MQQQLQDCFNGSDAANMGLFTEEKPDDGQTDFMNSHFPIFAAGVAGVFTLYRAFAVSYDFGLFAATRTHSHNCYDVNSL